MSPGQISRKGGADLLRFPRRYWRNFDWPLVLAVLLLIGVGMVIIYSASYSRLVSNGDNPFYYVKKQLLGFGVGLVGLVVVLFIDYRAWRPWTKLMFLGSLLLLGMVEFFGKTIFGSQRWIRIGPLNLQPSEIAKIVMIIFLARYLEKKEDLTGWKLLNPLILMAIPMGIILLQPDLGTSMIFVGITLSMLYVAGANGKHLALIFGSGGLFAFLVIFVSLQEWWPKPIIKPYQLNRILVFIDPYSDPTGAGWNVIQSMIAIGSGGFLGKGLLSGTQNQLNFLPANHTDFVFSVIGEELGLVGAVIVLSLYLFVIWRGLRIASLAKDRFGMLLSVGCVSLFFFHLIINVGMTLGMMPVTGLPLPFISYGGSTLLTNLLAVGILLNVGLRRQKIMF